MGFRSTIGAALESTIGRERTSALRRAERQTRNRLAARLAVEPPKKRLPKDPPVKAAKPASPPPAPKRAASRWQPSESSAIYPEPTMTRHELLTRLHEVLRPRTYLETGVNKGNSLALSRARSVGIDPAFSIDCPVQCDLQLVRLPSDDYFAGPDCGAHFDGVPLDLAFIDGMHLSEFALRDFINVEKLMADTGVVVFDDMLPRNALEAARDRKTRGWTGDVYKVAEVLRRHRPELVVLLVNTHPTGTAVVVNLDHASRVLSEAYGAEESYLLKPDPQTPPDDYLDRSAAVEPDALLSSPVWEQLAQHRDSPTPGGLQPLWDALRELEQGPARTRLRDKEPVEL